jgi:ribonucleoside-triphosphate reductase
LKSDITDSYFNSIGCTALEVGSVKVATLNLARLAYIAKSEQEYLVLLKDLVEKDLKILDIVRGIIKRNIEKGLLPTYTHGLKSLESQYNTVGINGIYETMKAFGYVKFDEFGKASYTQEAYDFGRKIFKTITNVGDMFCLNKDYKWNKEQVPAEQAAYKMQKADEFLYPDKVIKDLPLYGNQWIPLGIDATLQERTKICSAFDGFCNGGSIMHVNIDAPFDTFDKAWTLLNWVASQKVTYFAFNGKISQCEDSHVFYGERCPICGKPKKVEFTRVVGFYVPTTSWSKARKEEFNKREWMALNNEGNNA